MQREQLNISVMIQLLGVKYQPSRNKMGDIITEARQIADLCDSEFASDKEIAAISAEFQAKYGCHWTEVLN